MAKTTKTTKAVNTKKAPTFLTKLNKAFKGRVETNTKLAEANDKAEVGTEAAMTAKTAKTRVRYINRFMEAAKVHAEMMDAAGCKPEHFTLVPRNVGEKKIPYILNSIAKGAPLNAAKETGEASYCNLIGILANSKHAKNGVLKVTVPMLQRELQHATPTQAREIIKTAMFLTGGYKKQVKADVIHELPLTGLIGQFSALFANK